MGGSRILACRFKSYDRSRNLRSNSDSRELRYDGFYLAPCGLESGGQTVEIKGFPDLIHTEEKPLSNDILARAKASARKVPKWLIPPVAREIAISGTVSEIEDCIQYIDIEHSDGSKLESYTLETGEEACVFGLWRDGALHSSFRRARGMPVYKGDVQSVLARLKGESLVILILGCGFLAISAGVAIWSLI